MSIKNIYWFFSICLLFLHVSSTAQINVKVGYNLARMEASGVNSLISGFNVLNSDVIDIEMPELHFNSGIEIGLRYSFGNANVEFSFDNLNNDREALGELDDGSLFRERIFYSQQGLNLSLENRFSRYGWGAGISRRTQRIKKNISTSDQKVEILSVANYALKTFLIFDLGGTDNLSFELRPFLIYPLKATSLSGLATEWGISDPIMPEERFVTFGITLAFYNGPQG